jgi:hypothetical protein
VSSIRTLVVLLLVATGTACGADLLAPSSDALVGRWYRGPEAQNPTGQFIRNLEFTADGHFVATGTFRGIYPQLPADAVASISQQYGTFRLDADTLRFSQDSVRSWDYLTGTYFHAGPMTGVYFEGPPTAPVVEVTRTSLTLRYMVDPGAGNVQVTDHYLRDR